MSVIFLTHLRHGFEPVINKVGGADDSALIVQVYVRVRYGAVQGRGGAGKMIEDGRGTMAYIRIRTFTLP